LPLPAAAALVPVALVSAQYPTREWQFVGRFASVLTNAARPVNGLVGEVCAAEPADRSRIPVGQQVLRVLLQDRVCRRPSAPGYVIKLVAWVNDFRESSWERRCLPDRREPAIGARLSRQREALTMGTGPRASTSSG